MKDPAFLFYPGDYLRDTQMLSEKTQVAYDRIMCEHMRNICITKQQLNFLTKRLSPEELEELKMVLTEIKGGYQIEWVADSITKRKAYSESRRKNREGKTKEDMNNTSSTYDKHMENESENVNEVKEEKEIIFPFDKFWDLYNKKVGSKDKCEKKWNSLKDDERGRVMITLPNWLRQFKDKQFQPYPETYLNNKRWNDVLEFQSTWDVKKEDQSNFENL